MIAVLLPGDDLVAVDGVALVGFDWSQLDADIVRIDWDGEAGVVSRRVGGEERIASAEMFEQLLAQYDCQRIDRQQAAVDGAAWTIGDAVGRVLELIVAESQRRQHELIEVEGILYYADAWATATVEAALAAAQSLGLADTDPVRVPPPLQPGWWLSASLDASGNRVAVPMTVGGLKALAVALYDRNGLIWGAEMVHKATVEAMAAGGATAEQILQYDHTAGWPTT